MMVKAGNNKYFYFLPPGLNFRNIFRILSPVVKNRNIFILTFTYRDPISFRALFNKIAKNYYYF